jgi:hypothetical protein
MADFKYVTLPEAVNLIQELMLELYKLQQTPENNRVVKDAKALMERHIAQSYEELDRLPAPVTYANGHPVSEGRELCACGPHDPDCVDYRTGVSLRATDALGRSKSRREDNNS